MGEEKMKVEARGNYSFGGVTSLSFDEAVARIRGALKNEGFGVLTEIDAQKVLKEKLGIDRPRYLILGACNPNYAHRGLEHEPELGTLLPCNVVVYENEEGKVVVTAMDPEAVLKLVGNPKVGEIGREVRKRIQAALETI